MIALLALSVRAAEPPALPSPGEISRRRTELVWPRPEHGRAAYRETASAWSNEDRIDHDAELEVHIGPEGLWTVRSVHAPYELSRPDALRDQPIGRDVPFEMLVQWRVTEAGDVEVDTDPAGIVREPLSHLQLVAPGHPVRPGDAWNVEPSTVRGTERGFDFLATLAGGGTFEGWVRRDDAWLAAITVHLTFEWQMYGYAAEYRYDSRLLVDPADGLPVWITQRETILTDPPLFDVLERYRESPSAQGHSWPGHDRQ